MTNMRPYCEMAGYLRGLYTALDKRDRLTRASLAEQHRAGDALGGSLANLAGTIASGDERLLPEENEFLRHILHVEGFTFDGAVVTVPDTAEADAAAMVHYPSELAAERERDLFDGAESEPEPTMRDVLREVRALLSEPGDTHDTRQLLATALAAIDKHFDEPCPF